MTHSDEYKIGYAESAFQMILDMEGAEGMTDERFIRIALDASRNALNVLSDTPAEGPSPRQKTQRHGKRGNVADAVTE